MEGTEDFDSFYAATFARLVGQLAVVTGDGHEAEDVIQEAMADALQRLSVARRQVIVLYYLADLPLEQR